jgi:crotonobetainyl-CoA:carnitine CoA-transferase CaiB-like acyl-CoA transferase
LRRQHGDELSSRLEKVLKSRPAAEWLRLLNEHDVPVDLCVTPGEATGNEQIVARETVQADFVPFPVWADGRRRARIRSGVPQLGEHSREILVELGFDDAEIAEMRKMGSVPI